MSKVLEPPSFPHSFLKDVLEWSCAMGLTETLGSTPSCKLKDPGKSEVLVPLQGHEDDRTTQPFPPLSLQDSASASSASASASSGCSYGFNAPKAPEASGPFSGTCHPQSPLQDHSRHSTPSLMSSKGSLSALHADVQKAQTLEALKTLLLNFEGCSLKKTAINTVFGVGNPKAPVMVVGEAPGADEDRQGLPFVGRSGKLLDLMFEAIGLSRHKNLYISNVIPWRPPGNRQPTTLEITLCLAFIQRLIELVSPHYLILIGGVSMKALLGTAEGITRLRGKWMSYTSPGLPHPLKAMALYHPAYLLRSPGQKRKSWQDLLTLSLDLQETLGDY